MSFPDSAILVIELSGDMPGRDPSFRYLWEDGTETTPDLQPKHQRAPRSGRERGFLSRLLKRREELESVRGNAALFDVVEGQLMNGVRKYIIDLEEVRWVTSVGLGHLVRVWSRISASEGALVLIATSPRLLEIFRITKLDRVFTCAGSIEEAVQCLKEKAE